MRMPLDREKPRISGPSVTSTTSHLLVRTCRLRQRCLLHKTNKHSVPSTRIFFPCPTPSNFIPIFYRCRHRHNHSSHHLTQPR
jgi:hypothetical protein